MGNEKKPDPKAFIDSLRGPMPLQKKLFFLAKSNALKIVTAKTCCGHPGGPGVDRGLIPLPAGDEKGWKSVIIISVQGGY